jgi:esterase
MKLFFRKYGSGKPLIILHGLFGQSDNWNTLAKKFGENGFEVFVVDVRNHGLSPHADEWNYEVMAEDLKELISDEKINSPVLLGHSMGGKVVMYFELLFSGTAEKIIVCDIAPRAYSSKHTDVIAALNSVDFEKVSSRKEVEMLLDNFHLDVGTKQFLLKNLYWKDEASKKLAWRFNLKAITESYDNISAGVPKGNSNVNALFIAGEKSDYITAEDKKEIRSIFPNAKSVTIKGAGHWIHAEKPAEFFETVIHYLKSV